MLCSQCGRPAMYQNAAGHLLCLRCHHLHMQAFAIGQQQIGAMLNYLNESMERTSGVPRGFLGRYPIPQPTVHTGPTNVQQNNVRVQDSVVDALNVGGTIQRLKVALQDIHVGGQEDVAAALHALTVAVAKSNEIGQDTKRAVLDQITYLASQAALPKQQRDHTISATVFNALRATLGVAADLATVWGPVSLILGRLFSTVAAA